MSHFLIGLFYTVTLHCYIVLHTFFQTVLHCVSLSVLQYSITLLYYTLLHCPITLSYYTVYTELHSYYTGLHCLITLLFCYIVLHCYTLLRCLKLFFVTLDTVILCTRSYYNVLQRSLITDFHYVTFLKHCYTVCVTHIVLHCLITQHYTVFLLHCYTSLFHCYTVLHC